MRTHLWGVVLRVFEQLNLGDQDRLLLEDIQYPVPPQACAVRENRPDAQQAGAVCL